MTPPSPASGFLPQTPCIGICTMGRKGECAGCGRTLEEISGWPMMGAEGRAAIYRRLAAREAAVCGETVF